MVVSGPFGVARSTPASGLFAELFGGLVGGSERAATDVLYMALAVVIGVVACALILIIIVILVRFRLCAPPTSAASVRRSRAHHYHHGIDLHANATSSCL